MSSTPSLHDFLLRDQDTSGVWDRDNHTESYDGNIIIDWADKPFDIVCSRQLLRWIDATQGHSWPPVHQVNIRCCTITPEPGFVTALLRRGVQHVRLMPDATTKIDDYDAVLQWQAEHPEVSVSFEGLVWPMGKPEEELEPALCCRLQGKALPTSASLVAAVERGWYPLDRTVYDPETRTISISRDDAFTAEASERLLNWLEESGAAPHRVSIEADYSVDVVPGFVHKLLLMGVKSIRLRGYRYAVVISEEEQEEIRAWTAAHPDVVVDVAGGR